MKFVAIILMCIAALQASAQVSLNEVVKKYSDYKKSQQGSRIHLVFNQDRYTAGDTVWFKAYFFNNDMSPVKGRQLVNFGLVSPEGNIVQQFMFGITNGIGLNQVILPGNLSPGIYSAVAYNSWVSPVPLFNANLVVVGEKIIRQSNQALQNNVRLSVQPGSEGFLMISFSSGEGSVLRYQELLLLVTDNNKIIHSSAFTQGTRDVVRIETKAAVGINRVSILDKVGRVVATGGVNIEAINDNEIAVSISGGEQGFKTRQDAKLSIALTSNSQPVEGEFSVKILNHSMFKEEGPSFESELASAVLRMQEPWKQVLSRTTNSPVSFITDLSKKGTAFYGDGTPVPAGTRIVFYLQQHDIVLQAFASAKGRFTLSIPDLPGKDELIAIGDLREDDITGLNIIWDEKSMVLPPPPASTETEEQDDYGVFSATKELIDKSFGFYGSSESGGPVRTEPATNNGLEERVGGADLSVEVTRYVAFETMTELIREVIPSLQSRTVKGKTLVQVVLSEPMPVAKTNPLFIIDNIVTRHADYFLSLKPSEIATMKIVRSPSKLIPLGSIGKNGIVIVETIKGDARPPVERWQLIEGINLPISFKSSLSSSSRRPEFRSTIFWAPTYRTTPDGKAEINFQCSDDVGEVKVRVEGVTKEGRAFSGERLIKVTLGKR